jgi:hypothetical protein
MAGHIKNYRFPWRSSVPRTAIVLFLREPTPLLPTAATAIVLFLRVLLRHLMQQVLDLLVIA